MNQEHFTFHLQYKHSDRLDNRKYEKLSYPKNPKRCDPIHSLGARGPRMCRPTLEISATCENNLWYPGYPIQITLLKTRPHGEMLFATIATLKLSVWSVRLPGACIPRSNSLPFYTYHVWQKRYPFYIPYSLQFCIPLNCCKCRVFKIERFSIECRKPKPK